MSDSCLKKSVDDKLSIRGGIVTLRTNNLWIRTLAALATLLLPACASFDVEGNHDWVEQPHHISILGSGTFEEEESAPSVGIDYEYRASELLGIGAVAETAFGEIDVTTVLAVADLHITNHFIVQTGPGVDFVRGEREEIVYRIGVLYEWEQDGYTISPQLHYDWTSGEDAIILGVAFGVGF